MNTSTVRRRREWRKYQKWLTVDQKFVLCSYCGYNKVRPAGTGNHIFDLWDCPRCGQFGARADIYVIQEEP